MVHYGRACYELLSSRSLRPSESPSWELPHWVNCRRDWPPCRGKYDNLRRKKAFSLLPPALDLTSSASHILLPAHRPRVLYYCISKQDLASWSQNVIRGPTKATELQQTPAPPWKIPVFSSQALVGFLLQWLYTLHSKCPVSTIALRLLGLSGMADSQNEWNLPLQLP